MGKSFGWMNRNRRFHTGEENGNLIWLLHILVAEKIIPGMETGNFSLGDALKKCLCISSGKEDLVVLFFYLEPQYIMGLTANNLL